MRLFDRVLSGIEVSRDRNHNSISFSDIFPRLSNYIPGVQKGKYYCITGSPGSGKTQFTDFAFMYHPLDFESDIRPDITYFSFEISKEAKIRKGICKRLFEKYGVAISPNILGSIGELRLSTEILDKVKECADYFYRLEEFVKFYDEPLTPSKIAQIMERKFAEEGKVESKLIEGPTGPIRVPDKYIQTNPNKYPIFIFDHVRLISNEPGQSLHQSLSTFSSNNVHFRNKYDAIIVNVHQQSTEGAVEQFNQKGSSITSKVEPQLSLLGDNRTLSQDYDIVLGMFSPFRYEIDQYRGYKTDKFQDRCRFVNVLKNREGEPDKWIGLYFNGMTNYFEELPLPTDFTTIKNGVKSDNEVLYEKYAKGIVGIRENQRKLNF